MWFNDLSRLGKKPFLWHVSIILHKNERGYKRKGEKWHKQINCKYRVMTTGHWHVMFHILWFQCETKIEREWADKRNRNRKAGRREGQRTGKRGQRLGGWSRVLNSNIRMSPLLQTYGFFRHVPEKSASFWAFIGSIAFQFCTLSQCHNYLLLRSVRFQNASPEGGHLDSAS